MTVSLPVLAKSATPLILAGLVLSYCCSLSVTGAEPDAPPALSRAIVLTLDGLFMRPPVHEPVANGRDTILAVSVVAADGSTSFLSAEDFKRLGLAVKELLPQTITLANQVLEKAEVVEHRDKRGVITHTELRSENSLLASAVLSPKFLAQFRTTIGAKLKVIIPSRTKIFVFPPATVPPIEEEVRAEFRTALQPVSLEILELDRSGITVAGTLRP